MKRKTFLCLMMCLCSMLVMAANDKDAAPAVSANEANFTFSVYGNIPERKTDYAEPHFLGQPIENKWNTFLLNYRQESEQSVGFSNTTVRFNKPVIYNAVQKINKYVKKACKKAQMDKEEAVKVMSHVLDCANVICFEENTIAFEEALGNADSVEGELSVFQHTRLVFE